MHNSSSAMSAPVTGVHKPALSKIPPAAAIRYSTPGIGSSGAIEKPLMPRDTRATLAPNRNSKRPNPGQLLGKVENKRCRETPP